MNLSEGDEPERLLGRAGDVVPLLVGQTLCSIHRLFLARVQESWRVREKNSPGQSFKDSAQSISWTQWHSGRVEHLDGKSKFQAHHHQPAFSSAIFITPAEQSTFSTRSSIAQQLSGDQVGFLRQRSLKILITTVQECRERALLWNHLTWRSSARAAIHLSWSSTSGGSALPCSSALSLIRGEVRVMVTVSPPPVTTRFASSITRLTSNL